MEEFTDEDIISMYTGGAGMEKICSEFHIGKKRVRAILESNGVEMKKRGAQVVSDITKRVQSVESVSYPEINGYHYEAYSIDGEYHTADYLNKAGCLTSYIKKKYGVTSTTYERKKYLVENGKEWTSQWFEIISVKNNDVKKCPYCEWVTADIDNRSGVFEQHLIKSHGKSKIDYIKEFPIEKEYFSLKNLTLNRQMETDENKYIICLECGKKFSRIDSAHLKKHNLTKVQYMEKHGLTTGTICEEYKHYLQGKMVETNQKMDLNGKFVSKGESFIREFIESLGFKCEHNRSILKGGEIDIYIPEMKVGIEFNGNKWHTEIFGGKDKLYHLNKTEECEKQGIHLIHIMEDDFVFHKDIVLSKLKHILHKNDGERIMARKCTIKQIERVQCSNFMNNNHLQGMTNATVYIGAFYKERLVAVCMFTNKTTHWELVRFATDINTVSQGMCGKIMNYFIQNFHPKIITSFADRKWSTTLNDNLYSKCGFKFNGVQPPRPFYYNGSVDKYKRFHRFLFRKHILLKKYPDILNKDMTEKEMTELLKYDRIWDCGLIKYIWTEND